MARPELPHIGIILVGAPPSGWLVKKKESYKRSSYPHSVLFGCGIHLIAVEMLTWLRTLLCKAQNILQMYTLGTFKIVLVGRRISFKRLTPQEDKWVQDVQVHTCLATCNPFHNLHKLKHKVNRYVFSSCIPTYQKNNNKKDTTGGDSTWPNYTPWKMNGWNLPIPRSERKIIFQTSMIMFHVNLQGCT